VILLWAAARPGSRNSANSVAANLPNIVLMVSSAALFSQAHDRTARAS
jgi:hypothetical protein